jgi:DNA primase catalytic subunit
MNQIINVGNNTVLYRHIRLDNNTTFYIGIGNVDRPNKKSGRNKHWYNITSKTEYEVDILKSDLSWQDACELESILISFYGRKDLGIGTLVNMTDGGEGIKNISKETSSKISKKLTNDFTTKEELSVLYDIFTRRELANFFGVKEGLVKKRLNDYGIVKDVDKIIRNNNTLRENNGRSKKVIDPNTGEIFMSVRYAAEKNNINENTLRYYLLYDNTKTKLRFL